MTKVHVIELQYVDAAANSDKFYRAYLDQSTNEVFTQYGRNGTAGTFTKRKKLGTLLDAEHEMRKIVEKKAVKGYVQTKNAEFSALGGDNGSLDRMVTQLPRGGTPVAPQQVAAPVPVQVKIDPGVMNWVRKVSSEQIKAPRIDTPRPMLAETGSKIEPLIRSNAWAMQVKLDGERALIQVDDGQITVFNRQGQPKQRNVGHDMLEAFAHLTEGYYLFDGEIVGRDLWLFDMPAADGFHDETAAFGMRYKRLKMIVGFFPQRSCMNLRVVETATTEEAKRQMLADAEADSREGVMLREMARSEYVYARRSRDLLKFKFVKAVDAVVTRVGRGGKQNAVLALVGDQEFIEIGQASTIGKGPIEPGDVVEVKYLYVVDEANPRLYQPRIVRTRDDKDPFECGIDQLDGMSTNRSYE